MSTNTSIDSSYNLHFPPLPSTRDGKPGTKSSLASVIHSSFSGWDPEKSSALIERTIQEIYDSSDSDDTSSLASSHVSYGSVDSKATTRLSETTEVASMCESEAGYGDEDWEVHARKYLEQRVLDLTDEYFRKSDFRVMVKKKSI